MCMCARVLVFVGLSENQRCDAVCIGCLMTDVNTNEWELVKPFLDVIAILQQVFTGIKTWHVFLVKLTVSDFYQPPFQLSVYWL